MSSRLHLAPMSGRGAPLKPCAFAGALVAVTLLLSGCRGQETEAEPIVPIRNMHDQPRLDPQELSRFFADRRTMREPAAHTVSVEVPENLAVATGRVDGDRGPGGQWVEEIPLGVTQELGGAQNLMKRGQERYGIYCAPCHGLTGAGNGTVAMRAQELGYAALVPPTLGITPEGDDRLLHVPDGHIFAVISNGIRNMPAYRHNIPVRDRWAIVGYVRALQLRLANQPGAAATAAAMPAAQDDAPEHAPEHAEETL